RSLPATHTSVLVLLHPHATPFAPHSFPTRRSSDLTQRRSTMKPMSAAIASAAITTPATMSPALPRRTSMYSPCHRTCALQVWSRSEEHTSELQSRFDLVCRLLLEKKNDVWERREKP